MDYPPGTRLLFWLSRRLNVGVHQLYARRPVRFAITVLDKLGGKSRT